MLSRWILDGSKEISSDAAWSFHRRSFSAAASVRGGAGPARWRFPMARLEPDRWWWCMSRRLGGLSSKSRSVSICRADAAGVGSRAGRAKDHSLAARRSCQDPQLLLRLLVHDKVVAVGDVVRVNLFRSPLHLLGPDQLAQLLVVVPEAHVSRGEPKEGLEQLLELFDWLAHVDRLLPALVFVVEAHTDRLDEEEGRG